MAKTLEDEIAELLESMVPPANVVDFDDVARRVIARVDERRGAEREPHDRVAS
jgi:hypothetical protein